MVILQVMQWVLNQGMLILIMAIMRDIPQLHRIVIIKIPVPIIIKGIRPDI